VYHERRVFGGRVGGDGGEGQRGRVPEQDAPVRAGEVGVGRGRRGFPKLRFAIVRRHELGEIALTVGLDGRRAWHLFEASEGHLWRGHYMPESRSEEGGYTAARLVGVRP
jgi:hypothetical protein